MTATCRSSSQIPLLTADFAHAVVYRPGDGDPGRGRRRHRRWPRRRQLLRHLRCIGATNSCGIGAWPALARVGDRASVGGSELRVVLSAVDLADGSHRTHIPWLALHRCGGRWVVRPRNLAGIAARLEPVPARNRFGHEPDERWRTWPTRLPESPAASARASTRPVRCRCTWPIRSATARLREWVYREVPSHQSIDPVTRANKVLVRRHIAARFGQLPYVARKGSFRFDLCGLAKDRFEQVHAFASQASDVLPGAAAWLERNRDRLDNKYHASKFYLLAIVLPWLVQHACTADAATGARPDSRMSPYYGRPDFSALDIGRRPRTDRWTRVDGRPAAQRLRLSTPFDLRGRQARDVRLRSAPRHARHDRSIVSASATAANAAKNVETDLGRLPHIIACCARQSSGSCADLRAPWLLQSGGKDSTTTRDRCRRSAPGHDMHHLPGRREENEIASARHVAMTLGLRHETLLCDPGRAYDRYLAMRRACRC